MAKREAAAKAGWVTHGVTGADALGYAAGRHVALWLPITPPEAHFMILEGIKWSDSLRMRKETET
jgi:hypothetical protein